jgi:hypothetical protein
MYMSIDQLSGVGGPQPVGSSDWIQANLNWLVPSLLVVIGGIATFIRWMIKKPKTSAQSIQQTASPTVTQNNNPITNVIVHPAPAQQTPAPAPVSASTPTGTIESPNISFLRTRTAIVAGSSLDAVLWEKRNSKGGTSDVTALVACFRNEPSDERRVSNELSVGANLVFRNAEGKELGDGIARACWLEHGGASVDLDVGHTRCAVLMVVAGGHNPIFVPYKTRVRVNHRLTFVTEAFRFEHPPATIELRLLSSRNELILPAMFFDFLLVDGVPSADLLVGGNR